MKQQKRIQLKQRLSIANIGKFRFWTGIVLGVFSAALFFGFIFYVTEFIDFFRVIQNFDLPIKNDNQLLFEKAFLLALSVAFGNNTMLRFWFVRPSKYFNKTYKYTSARIINYSLLIEYIVLFGAVSFITRFLLYLPFIDFNLFNEYGYILYLFPVYLFYIAWTEVSRYVKTQRWMLKVFTCCIVLVTLLCFIDISDYKIGKTAFRKMHREKIEYIEQEVEKAKRYYDISFSKETINSLKELHSERAINLLKKARSAFKTKGNVSLDTIILEKILIHNFKGYYIDRRESYNYIFPFQAYEQLRKIDPKSAEATELLNILVEFHELSMYTLNVYDIDKNSSLHHNKVSVLSNENGVIRDFGYNLNYDRMYDQTSFLLYHIQKLGTYNHHPFFNTSVPYPPPPPMFDVWIQKNFPEFNY